jgi:hypothetical protein
MCTEKVVILVAVFDNLMKVGANKIKFFKSTKFPSPKYLISALEYQI